ncbi:MAG: MBL fold metallo-hydrolase [bacterium]|nr:MBL fold metallo-hydrolase [bacterium]
MNIKFLGVGSAFTTADYFQSNLLITADSGKRLLVDCGTDVRFSLAEAGLGPFDIDAVYLSHQHADHLGGIEFLVYATFFSPDFKHPLLFAEENLLHTAWEHSIKGGLGCVDDVPRKLDDFFRPQPVAENGSFEWEGNRFTLVKMPHVITQVCQLYSYGLLMESSGGEKAFFSTDALYQPDILAPLAEQVQVIWHDAETRNPATGVHAHYEQLVDLPAAIKAKTWLYHYQPNPEFNPLEDGFLGFVAKGQEFTLKSR